MKRSIPNQKCVNVERLERLADLLLSKPYQWYEYRLDAYPMEKNEQTETWYSMPTLDVVISETINVFPDQWVWHAEDEIAYFRDDPLMNPTSSAMLFYNLDIIMVTHLFVPFRQSPHYFGGTDLGLKIRPSQVGNNIKAFLKTYQSILN